MDNETNALLKQILTAQVIRRSLTIRTAWRLKEEERTGEPIPDEDMPPPEKFIEDAVNEIASFRDLVTTRLLD
jgi:hypothetical protein